MSSITEDQTTDDLIDFEEDSKVQTTESQQAKVLTLAKSMLDAKAEVDRLKEELRVAENFYDKIRHDLLPMEIRNSGIDGIKMGGYEISVGFKVRASMKPVEDEASRAKAALWLASVGRDALVKKSVVMEVGKEEMEVIDRIRDELKQRYQEYNTRSNYDIHHSTLSSTIRKMVEAGETVPSADEIGINLFMGDEAKVKKL